MFLTDLCLLLSMVLAVDADELPAQTSVSLSESKSDSGMSLSKLSAVSIRAAKQKQSCIGRLVGASVCRGLQTGLSVHQHVHCTHCFCYVSYSCVCVCVCV